MKLTAPYQPDQRIAATMRDWLRRRMAMRAGGLRSNPLHRISQAVIRALKAQPFRLCTPGRMTLTIRLSSNSNHLSGLGLGLAGGGGGSPDVS